VSSDLVEHGLGWELDEDYLDFHRVDRIHG
jgi:hypothetical protein